MGFLWYFDEIFVFLVRTLLRIIRSRDRCVADDPESSGRMRSL